MDVTGPPSPEPEPFAYEYDWRPAELGRAVRWMTWQRMRAPWKRAVRLALYAFAGFCLLVAVAAWADGYRAWAVVLGGLALILCAVVLWLPALAGALAVRRLQGDPNTGHSFRMRFDPEGVHLALRTTRTTLLWGGVQRVAETPEFLFFFSNPRFAYYLPKRTVGDPDGLRRAIQAWLPEGVRWDNVG